MKTKAKTSHFPVSTNHNQTVKHEAENELNRSEVIETEEMELGSIAAALLVRSGVKAGLIPCV
jgi:hypothetical protein